MIKKFTLLFSSTLMVATMAVAQSFTAMYTFDSVKTTSGLTDPSAVPVATGATFGSFSSVGTSANSSAAGRFSFTSWPTGSINNSYVYDSLTGTIDLAKYYEVTITPQTNYVLTLTGLTFKAQRSSTGIRTYSVRSSADSYAANLPASVVPSSNYITAEPNNIFYWVADSINSGKNGSTITLGTGAFNNIAAPITFRFYAWNSEASTGTFSIDTVVFAGSASLSSNVTNVDKIETVVVYPNPSNDGVFNVSIGNNDATKTTVKVYNVIGKLISSKEMNGIKDTIDLSNQPNGSYFVSIKNEKDVIVKKVIINK